MLKTVHGVGINDGKYPATLEGKTLKEYAVWQRLLERCYNPKYQKRHPAYIGCQASENFKNYSYFYEWCQNQIGFNQEGFQLDKDLIFKGNKLYSEDTCLFLPSELNNLLISSRVCRGNLPVGVSVVKQGFLAACCRNTSSKHIGYFDTPEEAFHAYKKVKENFIKAQAEKWKAYIDPRAYAALRAYEVAITD